MTPTVEAAIIAGGVGVVTLIGTLAAQFYGIRRTSKDALNARFATAAEELGSDKPAVRLAGVYAMAGLADDWEENRQTCIDVLCGYLRMPYEPDPGKDASEQQKLAFQASREVRYTVIRVITAHLRRDAALSWQGRDFDFTGVVFDGGDFSFARFSGGTVDFGNARFSGGGVNFMGAEFSGATVYFMRAEFSRGLVNFSLAGFSGGTVNFDLAEFSGAKVHFIRAEFSGGTVDFSNATFSGGTVDFSKATFSRGAVDFSKATFSRGAVDFSDPVDWSSPPTFPWTDTPPSGVKLPRREDQPMP
jgi:hypothetical protein